MLTVDGMTCLVKPPLRADVSITEGWHADTSGNMKLRGAALQDQRDIVMTGDYTIVEMNEIIKVSTVPPGRVGCPGVFVSTVV